MQPVSSSSPSSSSSSPSSSRIAQSESQSRRNMNNSKPVIPYLNSCSKPSDPCHAHDAKAAHFLRHEVKNGVLAAMGIVDNLQEVYLKLVGEQQQQQQPEENPLVNHLAELNSTLGQLLGTVVDNAMTLEVVHGDYVPTHESVHLPTLLKTQDDQRFPIEVVREEDFPTLLLDPNLVRTVHNNALSNACKFGQHNGEVKTLLSYNHSTQTFQMQVQNAPGPGHEQLLHLTPQEQDSIFQEQTQLPCHQGAHQVELVSEGNGAWIMQNCAKTMGGHCSVLFEPNRTVLSLECPALVSPDWKPTTAMYSQPLPMTLNSMLPFPTLPPNKSKNTNTSTHSTNSTSSTSTSSSTSPQDNHSSPSFTLPANTYCIVMEDSAVQRKMLQRYLARAGIKKERCIVWGSTQDEILNFVPRASRLIQEHPRDNFLIIMDEHLDIMEGGLVSKTVSGSYAVQQLRHSMLPREEARVLALIRSANDSSQEQKLYQDRAHGFISKGPLKNANLLQAIQPWWERKFPSSSSSTTTSTASSSPSPSPSSPMSMSEDEADTRVVQPEAPFSPQTPPRKRSRRTLALPRPASSCDAKRSSNNSMMSHNRWQQKARSSDQLKKLVRRSIQRTKTSCTSNAYWDHKTLSKQWSATQLAKANAEKAATALRAYQSTPALLQKMGIDRSLSRGQAEGLRNFFFARA